MLIQDKLILSRSLSISLVIPTKIDVNEKMRSLELNTMKLVLSECSKLVDLGYIDEIIIIDGSLDEQGNPNFNVLDRVVETAYNELDLFQRQVKLVNDNKAQALMASRGFFNFIIKTIHQSDPTIFDIYVKFGLNITELTRIPMGKGAALWLSIPLTAGDVVCYVDSDIMNFTKEFVIALCHPIIQRWENPISQISLVKACYNRLTLSIEPLSLNYFFGGRVTRLFALPMLRVLSRNYPDIFGGLNSLKYPLSGEFAIKKTLLKSISFPNDYSIELAMLKQVIASVGFTQIAQMDLNVLHHIGQSPRSLQRMVAQIAKYITKILEEESDKLSQDMWKKIMKAYKDEVKKLLIEYAALFNEIRTDLAQDLKIQPSHSRELDLKISKQFFSLLDKSFVHNTRNRQTELPAWMEVSKKANYFTVNTLLKRRGNQSTYNRLETTGLFYGL